MKKVININFQGRVIPIEESAYELLKSYVESLRTYFAKEEGRDEIINDIEGRIAELFSERLKKGVTCITDADVEAVIASMGRPADLEAAEMESGSFNQDAPKNTSNATTDFRPQGGLYRNADDKLIGGVCSGLANYLRIDPVIVRIIFLILIGAIFWVYILLWIVIPSKSIQTNITKRLYRSADQKVFAGVCGGLSAYFSVDVKVIRLIFALPLVFAVFFSGPFHFFTHGWDFMPGFRLAGGSLTGSLLLSYIILWIAVPVASTAAEKLEMKGEKIDLNSISSKVKEDLESLKGKAEQFGEEVKASAKDWSHRAKNASSEAAPMARKARSGLLNLITILIKVFTFFIMGIIAIALFSVLIGLLFGGYALLPLKDFFLNNNTEQFLVWTSLILFLGVPVVGIITWLVRRIIGVKSGKHYLGWIFGFLWTAGWVSIIWLLASITSNFKVRASSKADIPLEQPTASRLIVDVMDGEDRISDLDYFDEDWNKDWPFYGLNQDTFLLKTIRVNLVRSDDDQFHIQKINLSRGENLVAAKAVAEKIQFDIQQKDSLILLPADFSISKKEKFRNQQVVVMISVPLNKRIFLKRRLDDYEWFNVRTNSGLRGLNIEIDHDLSYEVPAGNEYIMTEAYGLINVNELDPEALLKGEYKKSNSDQQPATDSQEPQQPAAPAPPTYEYKDRKALRTSNLMGLIPSVLPIL